jgi:hypothetical protein
MACLVNGHGIAAMAALAFHCGVVIRREMNVLVGLLLTLSKAYGILEFFS